MILFLIWLLENLKMLLLCGSIYMSSPCHLGSLCYFGFYYSYFLEGVELTNKSHHTCFFYALMKNN